MWRIWLFLCMLSLKAEAVINRSEYKCSNTNFSPNSTYNANLQLVLSSLGLKTKNGFYSSSAGQSSADRVFASFICRGDVNGQGCEECVADAIKNSNQICPNQKEAIIWYDDCMLRYSDKSFFSIMQVEPNLNERKGENAEESGLFMNILNQTVNYLAFKVVKEYNKPKMSSAAARYYATKEAKAPAGKRIYSFAQCTPDISADNCSICLQKAISHLSQCCSGKIGGKILQPSCFLRYEIYPFYHSSRKVSGSRHKIVAIAASTSTVTVLLICALFYWVFTVKMAKKDLNAMNEAIGCAVFSELSSADSLKFGLSTIQAATNNFSNNNKVGEGGFGAVYRGMLPNGQEIAAKRLSKNSLQGSEEFMNEVESVTKLQHRNLVRLLGICFEGEEKILVYEFVPNRSLDYFLFDAGKKEQLDWPTRYKIIVGIVRGLLYLHEDSRLKIIHRDLKASNVLLDAHMNPKISDFGTARILGVDQIQGSTKRIVGTYGYMSPEYVTYGNFSVKSDVFSFGVLILEIVSGNRNSSFKSEYGEGLLSIASKYWREGIPLKLMDPKIKESCSTEEVMRCIHIGLLCVQEDMEDRPTMASVVAMLTSDTISLPLSRQPAFTISCLPMPRKPAFTHSSGKEFDTAYSSISYQNTC